MPRRYHPQTPIPKNHYPFKNTTLPPNLRIPIAGAGSRMRFVPGLTVGGHLPPLWPFVRGLGYDGGVVIMGCPLVAGFSMVRDWGAVGKGCAGAGGRGKVRVMCNLKALYYKRNVMKRHEPFTPMDYEHAALMNELNEFCIQVKYHLHRDLFPDNFRAMPKPGFQDIDQLQARINAVLRQDAKPLRFM